MAGRAEGMNQVDAETISRAVRCPPSEILVVSCCSAAFVDSDVTGCCLGVQTICDKSATSSLLASPTGILRSYEEDDVVPASVEGKQFFSSLQVFSLDNFIIFRVCFNRNSFTNSICNLAAKPISIITAKTTMLSRMAYTPPTLNKRQSVDNTTTDSSTSFDLLTDILNCGSVSLLTFFMLC